RAGARRDAARGAGGPDRARPLGGPAPAEDPARAPRARGRARGGVRAMSDQRRALVQRKTKETEIRVALDLEGSGSYQISTGIAFFDHMLESFAKHGVFDLELGATGDLAVDLHHTVEDVGITLGQAVREAVG